MKSKTLAQRQRRFVEFLEPRLLLTAQYTWQNVNIGAGGFVDGIFYDPHNQNTIYARTDIGGLYKTTNDGGTWTQLLDFVGNNTTGSGNGTQSQEIGVLSFAIDPENPNNLYADVGEYLGGTNPDGDVFYSTNGGSTWSTTAQSFQVGGNSNGRGDGEQIVVDPNDSNIVFLGSNSNGLWESINAGHSFSQITSFSPTSTTFVLFNPAGTVGSPSQTIYVGIDSTSAGTNLYQTTNGGTSWAQITGTGTLPTGYLPGHGVITNGSIYLGYANAEAPSGGLTNGGVYRYNIGTGVWANISPIATNGNFGYDGVAVDPENPNTVVVTSFDYYSGPDQIWRTINANATTPTWTALYDSASAQNFGYNGYDNTRNTTNAPWTVANGDGIGNWAAAVAINPYNSNQLMYGTGEGIWATNNLSNAGANTELTAANSWYFPDIGIEFTAVNAVAAPTSGIPLYSAMSDIGGFGNGTLAFSPQLGSVGGSGNSTDYAGTTPTDAAIVGSMGTTDGVYTTNDGATFTAFAANPGGSTAYSGGTVAESANGSTIVWAPSGYSPYYSTNNGSSWTAATDSGMTFVASVTSLTQSGGVPTAVVSGVGYSVGEKITISGAVNTGSTTTLYDGTYAIASIISTTANTTTFTYTDSNLESSTSSPATGTITAFVVGTIIADKVNPNYFYFWTENSSDNVWTLYISSDGGHTFNLSSGGAFRTGNVTLAPNPYVAGQLWLSSYEGIYESTNFGASFSLVDGTNIDVTANDMALGAPAPGTTTPAMYIYGTITSGGFDGVYRSDDGGQSWVLLNSISQQWGGFVKTMAADPNVFGRVYLGTNGRGILMGNPTSNLPANWVDTDINLPGNPGWATSSTTLSNGTVNSRWNVDGGGIGLVASPVLISSLSVSNDVATAVSTAANGFQVGQMVTLSGASNPVYDGTFVITSLANTAAGIAAGIGSATEFTFALVAANGTASGTITAQLDDQFNYAYEPITGSASISAGLLGLTNADGGNGIPQAGVMFLASTNPDDQFFELAQTTANSLVLEYRTTTGGSVTTQTLGSIPVGSEYIEIVRDGSNFTAYYGTNGTSWTQLGSTIAIAAMPATANIGLASTAAYNPQLTDAKFTNVSVKGGLTVANAAVANPDPVAGTSTALSALGIENGSSSGLTYTWSYTGPAGVTYSGQTNGSAAADNITANFTQFGSYDFTVTITDSGGLLATSQIAVTVNQTPTTIVVSPASSPVVPVGFTQQFSATATDQFGNAISSPSVSWGISGSSNSISTGGNATLGSTPGSYTVTATDGSAQGMATIISENFAVPSESTLNINLSSTSPVSISQSGGTITASQNGVQISFTGMTAIIVTDTASGDTLNFNGPLTLPFTFVNCGTSTVNVNSGTLTFAANVGGTVTVGTLSVANGGSAMITPTTTNSPTTLTLNSLSIAAGGTLDVTNNQVVIADPGGVPSDSNYATILGELANGLYNGTAGYTSAPGGAILSSGASGYGLGAVDGNDGVSGTLVSANTIEIAYTLDGDANLDGRVDATDFGIFAPNFGATNFTLGWEGGDFNYNGTVDATDFGLFAPNFGQQAELSTTFVATTTVTTTTTSTKVAVVVPTSTVNTTASTTPTLASSKSAQSSVLSGKSNGGSNTNVTVTSSHGSTKKPRHTFLLSDFHFQIPKK